MRTGYSIDVTDMIEQKIIRHISGSGTGLKHEGPIDVFTEIDQGGLARQKSWQVQVEEAVKNETDEFWQQV